MNLGFFVRTVAAVYDRRTKTEARRSKSARIFTSL